MNDEQNNIDDKTAGVVQNTSRDKNIRPDWRWEKIIAAAVVLAGAWAVFFAVFGNALPNVFSVKDYVSIRVETAEKEKRLAKKKVLPGKKYRKAKDFSLTDLDGKVVTLSSLKGKTVFIDFWASWCPPCRDSIPAVKKLHAKMKNNPNVVVLSVNMRESPGDVINFVKKYSIKYPVLLSNASINKDYDISGIPRFFIIDGDRNIINDYAGWHPSIPAKWEDDINEALSLKNEGSVSLASGKNQPPLSDLSGNAVDIASYKGKTLFLAFWVMQSYPCRQARPAFKAINNKLSKTADAEFLSVNVDSSQEGLRAFVKENNLQYPVLRATEKFADSYGVSSAYPACVIIDKNGKAVKTFFGYSAGDEKQWAKELNEILKVK
jgi:thiol-disulfide isomerase/thioredoxin